MLRLYKYSGAGNDFIVIDGRRRKACALCRSWSLADEAGLDSYRSAARISELCDRKTGFRSPDGRIGADGLIILGDSSRCDFRMEFYNPDGSSGMMCGNGGRCIVAFAAFLGIAPGRGDIYVFEAPDGPHTGEVLMTEGCLYQVRISMTDASDMREVRGGVFLNTGTRHLVKFTGNVDEVDVAEEGRSLRWDKAFAPEGTNVNFVSAGEGALNVRTFEKGVEAETLACGTGVVASAIAAYYNGLEPSGRDEDGRVRYLVHARGGILTVDFIPADPAAGIYLTGPAEYVAQLD